MNCPNCKGYKTMIMPDGKEHKCDLCHGSGEITNKRYEELF